MANSVSGFFWNLTAAIAVHKKNEMKAENKTPNVYATTCRLIYNEIWGTEKFTELPRWVISDLGKGARLVNFILEP